MKLSSWPYLNSFIWMYNQLINWFQLTNNSFVLPGRVFIWRSDWTSILPWRPNSIIPRRSVSEKIFHEKKLTNKSFNILVTEQFTSLLYLMSINNWPSAIPWRISLLIRSTKWSNSIKYSLIIRSFSKLITNLWKDLSTKYQIYSMNYTLNSRLWKQYYQKLHS